MRATSTTVQGQTFHLYQAKSSSRRQRGSKPSQNGLNSGVMPQQSGHQAAVSAPLSSPECDHVLTCKAGAAGVVRLDAQCKKIRAPARLGHRSDFIPCPPITTIAISSVAETVRSPENSSMALLNGLCIFTNFPECLSTSGC